MDHTAPGAGPGRTATVRLTGVFYLIIILCGVWSEGFARAGLAVPGDAAATAEAIREGVVLLCLSTVADTVMAVADIAVAVLFYVLLREVQPVLALLAMAFRLVQAALIGASLVLLAAVPGLALAGDDRLAAAFLGMHATGYDIGLVFFGVNALLMCALLLRSGAAPRLIALGIGAAGLVYLGGSGTRLLAPDLHPLVQPAYLIPFVAETALCLWLLARARV